VARRGSVRTTSFASPQVALGHRPAICVGAGSIRRLRDVDGDTVEAVDDLLEAVKQARRSKPARDL
jgi:hypothetical protein